MSTTKEINKQNPFDIAWEEKTKKIRIFRNVRVFILSPTPKNKNSEITDILQKSYNTEMWECSWNAIKLKIMWQVVVFWESLAPTKFTNVSSFLII